MGEVASAVQEWENSVKTLELSVKAMAANLKVLSEAPSNAIMVTAWDAVEATRTCLIAAEENEVKKFTVVSEHQRQQTMNFDTGETAAERKRREAAAPKDEPENGLHPQEPLQLTEGEKSKPSDDPDGEEGADTIVDADDDEEVAADEREDSEEDDDDTTAKPGDA